MKTDKLIISVLSGLSIVLISTPSTAQNQVLDQKDRHFIQQTKRSLGTSSFVYLKEKVDKNPSNYISIAKWWCERIDPESSEVFHDNIDEILSKEDNITLLNASYLAGTQVYCPQHKNAVEKHFATNGFHVQVKPQEIKDLLNQDQSVSSKSPLSEKEAIETPALTKIEPGSRIYVEPGQFGLAMAAAIQKKAVPVTVVTSWDRADFFIQSVTKASQQHIAERAMRIYLFWPFVGSGKRYEANIIVTNKAGDVIFADAVERSNPRKAASKIADRMKEHIERKIP